MDSSEVISETRKMIDEILELEDALERLAGAHIVVDGLTERLKKKEIENADLIETVADWKDRLAYFQAQCRGLALDLARAGDYDHKGKNERILQVITSLLEMATRRSVARDMDDIPF